MKFQTKYGDIYCSTGIYCSKSVYPAIASISYMAVFLSIFSILGNAPPNKGPKITDAIAEEKNALPNDYPLL